MENIDENTNRITCFNNKKASITEAFYVHTFKSDYLQNTRASRGV